MRIAIDAFGGDNAPLEVIKGASLARQFGHDLVLTGRRSEIERCAAENGADISGIEIADVPEVMTYDDEAKAVFKAKKNSSMGEGLSMLADGRADAFVSAGPTGALFMGGTFVVKRIKGVKRAALATVIPCVGGSFLLVDCGANAECRPEALEQFGVMGAMYMKRVMGIDNPRVGLANNGTEPSKGTELQQQAYQLLVKNGRINFVGNVEGRDIPYGACDVVVTDGFTGNLILKTVEGLAGAMFKMLKGVFYKSTATKLAAAVLKPSLREFKDMMDYSKTGGAPIIGLKKPIIKAHGSSNAEAIKNAVRQAISWSESGVTDEITAAFADERE